MKIKVNYKMSKLEKAIWNAQKHFTNEEFEPSACKVQVKGLKPAAKPEFDFSDLMNCKKRTGLTESEYQTKYHYAWSE